MNDLAAASRALERLALVAAAGAPSLSAEPGPRRTNRAVPVAGLMLTRAPLFSAFRRSMAAWLCADVLDAAWAADASTLAIAEQRIHFGRLCIMTPPGFFSLPVPRRGRGGPRRAVPPAVAKNSWRWQIHRDRTTALSAETIRGTSDAHVGDFPTRV